MKEDKCPKCGCTSLEAKHKGPHIGWYCTKCGAWVRWIPQHNKKAELNEPHQISIEEFMQEAAPEQMSHEELGITLPEEKACKSEIDDINSLYDDDDLPWE